MMARGAARWFLFSLSFGPFVMSGVALAETEGSLRIIGEYPGAAVFVDAEPVGTLPLDAPLTLAPGEHTIRVTKPGYTEFSEVVSVRRGATTEVLVNMLSVSMILSLTTTPAGARVFVDGRFAGRTPVELDLLAGERSLRIQHPGYRDVIRTLDARAGATDELAIELTVLPREALADEEAEWYEQPVTWIAVGVGAAVIAAGVVVVALLSAEDESRIDAFCAMSPDCIRLP
jgi:hypothetical protein